MPETTHRGVLTAGSRRARQNAARPHFVYKLWAKDRCLYVGMTVNLGGRLAQHQRTQSWWKSVTDVEAALYFDRDEARRMEDEAILRHQPRHNINLTDDPTERRSQR